jgi:hypothetical protein
MAEAPSIVACETAQTQGSTAAPGGDVENILVLHSSGENGTAGVDGYGGKCFKAVG